MSYRSDDDATSDFSDDDDAFARYAAQRSGALVAPGTVAQPAPEADEASTSWAERGPVTGAGTGAASRSLCHRMLFWTRPEHLEPLEQDGGGGQATGLRVWPCCIGLASILEQHGAFAGLRALELGAGTGVAGIVLAKLGAHVTLTDFEPKCLALCRRNARENGVAGCTRTARLAWEAPASRAEAEAEASALGLQGHLDLIIGSDLVYGGHANATLLLGVLGRLLTRFGSARTRVLIAFGSRGRVSGGGGDEGREFLARAGAAEWEHRFLPLDAAVADEIGGDDEVEVAMLWPKKASHTPRVLRPTY